MTEACDLSARDARRMMGNGALSPVELFDSCRQRIERVNPAVNAIVAERFDDARKEAEVAEAAIQRGHSLPLLHGLPIGVKDANDVGGLRSTYGSLIYKDNIPKINYTYSEIKNLSLKSKEREKDKIVTDLGEMQMEERKVEDMFKNLQLERWSVGLQKGLREYVGETYDKERGQNIEEQVFDDTEEAMDMSGIPDDDDYGDDDGDDDGYILEYQD